MAFRVDISAQAERDADAILERLLSQEVGEAGLHWFDELNKAILSLSEFPRRCPLAPENSVFPFEVRQLFYGQRSRIYRILFTLREDSVFVLHIRHGRRQTLTR